MQKGLAKKMLGYLYFFILLYLCLLAFLYVFQRNLMYFPGGQRPAYSEIGIPAPEVAKITPEPGLQIEGWYWPPQGSKKHVIIFFHGNGQAYPYWMYKLMQYRDLGYGIMFAEYRGYGGNSGSPSEQGLYNDARAYIHWLMQDKDIKPEQFIFYGESLGTGVAVQMAMEFESAALVLESPFSSAVDVGVAHYPVFPVRLLMKDRYENIRKIENIHVPVLFIHGSRDRIIPIRFGKKLYKRAGQPKRFVRLENGGHNNLHENGIYTHVLEFFEEFIGKDDFSGQYNDKGKSKN